MQPPDPPTLPASPASPARAAVTLAAQLDRHGFTGIYTATTAKFAVISITTDLTVWTDGHLLWCIHHGQRHSWPATHAEAAAARLTVLATAGF